MVYIPQATIRSLVYNSSEKANIAQATKGFIEDCGWVGIWYRFRLSSTSAPHFL